VTGIQPAPEPARGGADAPGLATGGADLERLVRWGRHRAPARVLDLTAGDGAVALAFADFTPSVVALDAEPAGLRAVRRLVDRGGPTGVRVMAGEPLALPYRDESFGVVTCRHAAHRFPELLPVLRQIARVLRRGGSFLLADLLASEEPEVAAFVLEVERGRNPRRARAYRQIEWAAFLRAAGLTVIDEAVIDTARDWDEWTAPMGPDTSAALGRLVRDGPARCREALAVQLDGDRIRSFTTPTLLLRADKD